MHRDQPMKNHGVRVTAVAAAIAFSLGIVYTWTVFSKNIPDEWGWPETHKSCPTRQPVSCSA